MFGYVRYDFPNLFIKDFALYKASYCGLCKGIGKACGQRARMGLSYDVTFLSVLLHNMTGQNLSIEKQNCFEHCVKKRPIAAVDALTEELGALNTVLVYYKLSDDVVDRGKGRGRRGWFKKGFKRAKKKYPELVAMIESFMAEQAETEKKETASPDMAADPTACMMTALSRYFLKEHASEATDGLFYALGKWVYLIDALDDYEKDSKKKCYNPFVLSFGGGSRAALMEAHSEEISFLFDTNFYAMRENLSKVKFYFNRDLTDNVILLGLPAETERVKRGEPRKKESDKL